GAGGAWPLRAPEPAPYPRPAAEARAAGRPEVRWLRGAMWRNFQVRYREINDLHKQMLRTSALVEGMAPGLRRELAVDPLLAGQSNDPYWHGLFGGIYLPDLRLANHAHLIAAQDLAIREGTPPAGGARGAVGAAGRRPRRGLGLARDLPGRPEVLLGNDGEIVTVKPDAGAALG